VDEDAQTDEVWRSTPNKVDSLRYADTIVTVRIGLAVDSRR
jgi:hypothetical protein